MASVSRNSPKRAESSESRYTLMDFMQDFPDDATCLDYLWRQNISLDGSHAYCVKCKADRRFHRLASTPGYSCQVCGHHIHPLAGTIFAKSSTSLVLWFHAIFLMSQTRCGISAKQLERDLGVTYKTAWRMFQKIRTMLTDGGGPMGGKVEMDETYVGGKRRSYVKGGNKGGGRPGKTSHKQPVFGMTERDGRVRAVVVPDAKRATLTNAIDGHLRDDATMITDEWPPYVVIAREYGVEHQTINHRREEYVRGDVHTNTIEGFWALTKNAIRGVHHGVDRKYLQLYLNEYAFRWNHRETPVPMFTLFLAATCRQVPSVA